MVRIQISNFSITPGNVIPNAVRDLLEVALCLDLEIPHCVRDVGVLKFPEIIQKLHKLTLEGA